MRSHFLGLDRVMNVISLRRDVDADRTMTPDLFVMIKLGWNKKLQLDSHIAIDTGIGGMTPVYKRYNEVLMILIHRINSMIQGI